MFKIKKKDVNETLRRSARLRRVKVNGHKTKIVGGSEQEIQDVKTKLDTMVIAGKNESKAKKELRRLGFLYG